MRILPLIKHQIGTNIPHFLSHQKYEYKLHVFSSQEASARTAKTFAPRMFAPFSETLHLSDGVYSGPWWKCKWFGEKLSIIVIFHQTGFVIMPGLYIQKNGIQLFLLGYLLELSIMTSFPDIVRYFTLGGPLWTRQATWPSFDVFPNAKIIDIIFKIVGW